MRLAWIALLAITVSACTTAPRQNESLAELRWQERLQILEDRNNWRANARIAVTTQEDGGNARMYWHQYNNDFDVRFSAALGQGTIQISQRRDGAKLVSPSGEVFEHTSAEELLYRQLGWRVPVQQLRLWLTGRPGETDDFSLNDLGQLTRASNQGWTVSIPKYSDDGYPEMPKQLILSREDIKVRVVVDNWSHLAPQIESTRILIPDATSE